MEVILTLSRRYRISIAKALAEDQLDDLATQKSLYETKRVEYAGKLALL